MAANRFVVTSGSAFDIMLFRRVLLFLTQPILICPRFQEYILAC